MAGYAYYLPDKSLDWDQTVLQMQRDARYDVANPDADLASLAATATGRSSHLPKVPKVFLSNDCAFNCAYCNCRRENGGKRPYRCEPRALAELSVQQSLQTGAGIFLSSAIYQNADYTQELLIETLRIIRRDLGYRGYIHAKVMPGADPELIRRAGLLANRLSVNIEVAKSEGYGKIARNKNKGNILTPMGHISRQIQEARALGAPAFASSQVTQLMAGSTGEDDRAILRLSSALYRKYSLARVYYTPFHYQGQAAGYDLAPVATPPWRVKRLYQADRLLQLYGFAPEDILPEAAPNLPRELDPKTAWALRNLHLFPVEVNRADYEMLIRIPGIGVTYAKRILKARRCCTVTHEVLKLLGIPLRRSRHFLTCAGKYTGDCCDNPARLSLLLCENRGEIPGQLSIGGVRGF